MTATNPLAPHRQVCRVTLPENQFETKILANSRDGSDCGVIDDGRHETKNRPLIDGPAGDSLGFQQNQRA